jgi:hypothetical protein
MSLKLAIALRDAWPTLAPKTRDQLTDLIPTIPGCPAPRGHYAAVECARRVTDPKCLRAIQRALEAAPIITLDDKRNGLVQMYTSHGCSRILTDAQKQILVGFISDNDYRQYSNDLDSTMIALIKRTQDANALQQFEDLLLITMEHNKRRRRRR